VCYGIEKSGDRRLESEWKTETWGLKNDRNHKTEMNKEKKRAKSLFYIRTRNNIHAVIVGIIERAYECFRRKKYSILSVFNGFNQYGIFGGAL
jgi:hypothetical protein